MAEKNRITWLAGMMAVAAAVFFPAFLIGGTSRMMLGQVHAGKGSMKIVVNGMYVDPAQFHFTYCTAKPPYQPTCPGDDLHEQVVMVSALPGGITGSVTVRDLEPGMYWIGGYETLFGKTIGNVVVSVRCEAEDGHEVIPQQWLKTLVNPMVTAGQTTTCTFHVTGGDMVEETDTCPDGSCDVSTDGSGFTDDTSGGGTVSNEGDVMLWVEGGTPALFGGHPNLVDAISSTDDAAFHSMDVVRHYIANPPMTGACTDGASNYEIGGCTPTISMKEGSSYSLTQNLVPGLHLHQIICESNYGYTATLSQGTDDTITSGPVLGTGTAEFDSYSPMTDAAHKLTGIHFTVPPATAPASAVSCTFTYVLPSDSGDGTGGHSSSVTCANTHSCPYGTVCNLGLCVDVHDSGGGGTGDSHDDGSSNILPKGGHLSAVEVVKHIKKNLTAGVSCTRQDPPVPEEPVTGQPTFETVGHACATFSLKLKGDDDLYSSKGLTRIDFRIEDLKGRTPTREAAYMGPVHHENEAIGGGGAADIIAAWFSDMGRRVTDTFFSNMKNEKDSDGTSYISSFITLTHDEAVKNKHPGDLHFFVGVPGEYGIENGKNADFTVKAVQHNPEEASPRTVPEQNTAKTLYTTKCEAVSEGPGEQAEEAPGKIFTYPVCRGSTFTIASTLLLPKKLERQTVWIRTHFPSAPGVTLVDQSMTMRPAAACNALTDSCELVLDLPVKSAQSRTITVNAEYHTDARTPSTIALNDVEILVAKGKDLSGEKYSLHLEPLSVVDCVDGAPSPNDPLIQRYVDQVNAALSDAEANPVDESDVAPGPEPASLTPEEVMMDMGDAQKIAQIEPGALAFEAIPLDPAVVGEGQRAQLPFCDTVTAGATILTQSPSLLRLPSVAMMPCFPRSNFGTFSRDALFETVFVTKPSVSPQIHTLVKQAAANPQAREVAMVAVERFMQAAAAHQGPMEAEQPPQAMTRPMQRIPAAPIAVGIIVAAGVVTLGFAASRFLRKAQ